MLKIDASSLRLCVLSGMLLTAHLFTPDALLAQAATGTHSVRQIIAHRGSSADRPENTLASISRAIEAGATAVEMDVRTTKDKHLVLLHDPRLDRTTDGQGGVADKTLVEIKSLDAGSWFDPRYRQERVPTLAEALALCRGKTDVLLDLKEQGDEYVAAVVAQVRLHGEPRRVIVGVRSVEQAREFSKRLPEARQLGLINAPEEIEAFAQARVQMIRLWPKWLADTSLVERVRRSGAKLHLNNTNGSPDEVLPLLVHRPDSLSSDDPARLLKTLSQVGEKRP